ncbi:STAS domain-containing protein [Streptomyces sp. MS06]|uniref:STAS domain-containing protein n=1 Tax=Streptomyces sp. MS06 TaxID=3385974 RepID=UPI00399FDEB4
MPLAQNPLSVQVSRVRDDVALVTVAGHLDFDTASEFQQRLLEQLREGRRHLLLELSSVPFMDSSGMNAVLRVHHEAAERSGSVHVMAPAAAVRRVLDLTGVSTMVPVSDGVDAALALVDGPASRRREA